VIIKPLVGQHTAEKEDSERGMGFDRALVFAKQVEAKLILLHQFWTKRCGTDVHG
jgi:hypothetical protein